MLPIRLSIPLDKPNEKKTRPPKRHQHVQDNSHQNCRSRKPLFYQGKKIDDFYLVFKEGKVVELKARVGEDILRGIVYGEENSYS